MNKALLIVPTVLGATFIAFERPAHHRLDAAHQAHVDQLAQARADEDARRLAAQQAAATESARRTAERERDDRLKAAARQLAYENTLHRLDEQTTAHVATSESLARELAALDTQLATLRDTQESTDRATFDLTKQLESQRTARRSLDLEIQRTTTMLTRRANETPWLK
jgi:membrane protein involved in colicin uptake